MDGRRLATRAVELAAWVRKRAQGYKTYALAAGYASYVIGGLCLGELNVQQAADRVAVALGGITLRAGMAKSALAAILQAIGALVQGREPIEPASSKSSAPESAIPPPSSPPTKTPPCGVSSCRAPRPAVRLGSVITTLDVADHFSTCAICSVCCDRPSFKDE